MTPDIPPGGATLGTTLIEDIGKYNEGKFGFTMPTPQAQIHIDTTKGTWNISPFSPNSQVDTDILDLPSEDFPYQGWHLIYALDKLLLEQNRDPQTPPARRYTPEGFRKRNRSRNVAMVVSLTNDAEEDAWKKLLGNFEIGRRELHGHDCEGGKRKKVPQGFHSELPDTSMDILTYDFTKLPKFPTPVTLTFYVMHSAQK